MQIITKSANSTLYFTLTERVTIASPYFLAVMTSRAGGNVKRFILASNQSTETERYDKFTVTETSGTEILTSGTVTLTPNGIWHYEIYEQSSSTNLIETQSGVNLLEKGMIRVRGTDDGYISASNVDEYKFP